jgi:hypothetical protein
MHGFVLQDWITIRGGSGIGTITQSEQDWLGLDDYEDIIAWIDVREATLANSSYIQFNLQTAPIKDEYLFVNMEASPLTVAAASTTPSIRKIIMAAPTTPQCPLGRWLRWQLVPSNGGSVNAVWDVTFRILAAANPCAGGGHHAAHPMHAGGMGNARLSQPR